MYKLRLRLCSYDHRLLDQSLRQIIHIVKRAGARVNGPVPLPVRRKLITVLRSPHRHKDSREQFEVRIHKRLLDIFDEEGSIVRDLERYILPQGIDIETKLMRA